MSVSLCMFALSTLRVTKFLLKNFTTTTTTIFSLAIVISWSSSTATVAP